ncbi:MAG: hypothetical protein M3488_09800 [Actinomycetota bacterium]|nr:hypothetical protein [Actinomycetota bacterium]
MFDAIATDLQQKLRFMLAGLDLAELLESIDPDLFRAGAARADRGHVIRHRFGWRHVPLPKGDHSWISPLGRHDTTSGRSP